MLTQLTNPNSRLTTPPMDGKETLALVNAILNGISGSLLLLGYLQIRQKNYRAHGWLMASALVVSTVFLACYLTSYYVYGDRSGNLPGLPRWIYVGYLIFLAAHVLMAIVVLPFIFAAVWQAYRGRWQRHTRYSRPAFWMWMYVSVTGVMVYFLLYQILPAIAARGMA